MVNSCDLGKQDITGKSFKKYGANDALNESEDDDALREESKSSNHNVNNDQHDNSNELCSSKTINTLAPQQHFV